MPQRNRLSKAKRGGLLLALAAGTALALVAGPAIAQFFPFDDRYPFQQRRFEEERPVD